MRYKLTARAHEDIVEMILYGVEHFGASQARKYHDSLEHMFGLLADMPRLGRAVPEPGEDLQRFEHGRHSIFNIAQAEQVVIVRVIDNRRDIGQLFVDH